MAKKNKVHEGKPPLPKVELTLEASKHEGEPLFMRTELATATLENGEKIEVAMSMGGGSVLITRTSKDGKRWHTYSIAPEAIVLAVLRLEGI